MVKYKVNLKFKDTSKSLNEIITEVLKIELQKKLNITMIYVTHDQEEAFALSDRIMVLNDSKIMQYDTPYNLYHNPSNEFVKNFIVNHLDMKVKSIEDNINERKK